MTVAEDDVTQLTAALATEPSSLRWRRLLFSAEQALLLVRIAADSGARRGEIAVLRDGDLDGRVLTVPRGVSHGVVDTTKSNRTRRLTLGSRPLGSSRRTRHRGSSEGTAPVGDLVVRADACP